MSEDWEAGVLESGQRASGQTWAAAKSQDKLKGVGRTDLRLNKESWRGEEVEGIYSPVDMEQGQDLCNVIRYKK